MEYKRESQFTSHASKRVFEEVYIDEDMPNERANSSNGSYMLRVPELFASDLSQEKAISPRRIMCEPKSHTFLLEVRYYEWSGTQIGASAPNSFSFTGENSLEDCLHHMREELTYTKNDRTCQLNYTYDKITGNLKLWAFDNNGNRVKFRLECLNYDDYNSFWHLLNQTGNPFGSTENDHSQYDIDVLGVVEEYQLSNVWNREPLYVHATFSSSKRHYLCRTGDFWFKPSKYYYDNLTNNEFYIYFTTDGSHFIIPYDAVKVIELCFILRQFARL